MNRHDRFEQRVRRRIARTQLLVDAYMGAVLLVLVIGLAWIAVVIIDIGRALSGSSPQKLAAEAGRVVGAFDKARR